MQSTWRRTEARKYSQCCRQWRLMHTTWRRTEARKYSQCCRQWRLMHTTWWRTEARKYSQCCRQWRLVHSTRRRTEAIHRRDHGRQQLENEKILAMLSTMPTCAFYLTEDRSDPLERSWAPTVRKRENTRNVVKSLNWNWMQTLIKLLSDKEMVPLQCNHARVAWLPWAWPPTIFQGVIL